MDAIARFDWQTRTMRKLAVVAFALLVALVCGVGYVAWNLNAFLQRQRDWIAARASEEIGRAVQFEGVSVSWRAGLAARLDGLQVAEDPTFGPGPFLEVDGALLVVDPWAALRGEYRVTRIVLDRPQVDLIQARRGWNFSGLGRVRSNSAMDREGDSPALAPLPLFVSVVEVRNGRVRYVDQSGAQPIETIIESVDVRLTDFQWDEPMALTASARLFEGSRADVRVDGRVGPFAATAGNGIPLDLRVSVSPVAGEAVRRHSLFVGALPPDLVLTGPIEVQAAVRGTLDKLTIDARVEASQAEVRYGERFAKPRGIDLHLDAAIERDPRFIRVRRGEVGIGAAKLALDGVVETVPRTKFDLHVRGDSVPLKGWDRLLPMLAPYDLQGAADPDLRIRGTGAPTVSGTVGVRDLAARHQAFAVRELTAPIAIEGTRLTFPKSRFRLNEADVELAGHYDYESDRFAVTTDLSGLLLAPLLREYAPRVARTLEGLLDATLQLEGTGSNWERLRSNLSGSGRVAIRDGRLREMNLAEAVLQGLTGVRGLDGLLPADLRNRYPEILSGSDTAFREVAGRVRLSDGRVRLEDLVLAALEQHAAAAGWISLDGVTELAGDLRLSAALTRDLVERAKPLASLVEADGRLRLPFRIAGRFPDVRPVPDVDYVMRTLGRSALDSGLDRLFRRPTPEVGRTPGESEEPTEGESVESAPSPTSRLEERLLRRGIDTLLGR